MRRLVFLVVSVVVTASPVSAQSPTAEPRALARVAVLGTGGTAAGDLGQAAVQLEGLLRSRIGDSVRFTSAAEVQRFLRDYGHAGPSNSMPLSDLVQLAKLLRLDFLLVLRLGTTPVGIDAEVELVDAHAGTLTVPVWGRSEGLSAKIAVQGIAAAADSLLRSHMRQRSIPPSQLTMVGTDGHVSVGGRSAPAFYWSVRSTTSR